MQDNSIFAIHHWLQVFWKFRFAILVALLIGGCIGLVINFSLPSLYRSEILIHVDDHSSQKENGYGIALDSPDLLKVRNLIGSSRIANGLIRSFGLSDLYGISPASSDKYEKTLHIFRSRLQLSTKNNSTILVSFSDRDPVVARNMLNQLYNNLERAIKREYDQELTRKTKMLKTILAGIDSDGDSVTTAIRNELESVSQRADLSDWNASTLHLLINRLELHHEERKGLLREYTMAVYQKKAGLIPNITLMQKAVKDVRNSPQRVGLLRVFCCSIIALFVALVLIVVVEQRKFGEQLSSLLKSNPQVFNPHSEEYPIPRSISTKDRERKYPKTKKPA